MYKEVEIKNLTPGQKIRYTTDRGSYIVIFNKLAGGKEPKLNVYEVKNGNRKYKYPKVSSINKLEEFFTEKSMEADFGKEVLKRDFIRVLQEDDIISFDDGKGVQHEVIVDSVLNTKDGLVINYSISNGKTHKNNKINVNKIKKLWKKDKKYSAELDSSYVRVTPAEYNNLVNILKKKDNIAYENKKGEIKKVLVSEVSNTPKGPLIRVYIPNRGMPWLMYVSNMKNLYIKNFKRDIPINNGKDTVSPINNQGENISRDEPSLASEEDNESDDDNTCNKKLKFLYDELIDFKNTYKEDSIKTNNQILELTKKVKVQEILIEKLKLYVVRNRQKSSE